MILLSNIFKTVILVSCLTLQGCQSTEFGKNTLTTFSERLTLKSPAIKNGKGPGNTPSGGPAKSVKSLEEILEDARPKVDIDGGFSQTMIGAVMSDPKVQAAEAEVLRRQSKLGVTKTQLDFQFLGTLYGGVEDVSDGIRGVAGVLSASKLVYDGGQLSSKISAEEYEVKAAIEAYREAVDERTLAVGEAWVEFERYEDLNTLISGRLAILDPLINQLERVADAGVGDATQVAAAQRTVSMIRVTQMKVQERLSQAELNLVRFIGKLPASVRLDGKRISASVPKALNDELAMNAPGVLANYAAYQSALKNLEAVNLRNSVNVGFETKLQRPFGGSSYDSDESVGIVVRKTLFNRKKLKAEVATAEAVVKSQEARLKSIYRQGRKVVESSSQSILSMDKAILMAKSNARALSDEITLLRKQLVIGQSTLDSVLSAEARRYDAESKEVHFAADRRIAQLSLLSAIGRLSAVVGFKQLTSNDF
jgi:outer membrane protein TolC